MKSRLILQNIDLELDVIGQEWTQGEELSGELSIVNKSSQIELMQYQRIVLAYVDIKKFKNLDEKSFIEIKKFEFENIKIHPNEPIKLLWNFKLDNNEFITDKKNSLYIFWGDFSKSIPASLMLNIKPSFVIQKIIEVFEIFFRFTKKEVLSNKQQKIEVKFTAPQTKEFATLDVLKVLFFKTADGLSFEYVASLKNIAADTTGMKVVKSEKVYESKLLDKNLLLTSKHINQDFVQLEIKNALNVLMIKK